jgi:hypothetical protein
MVILLRGPFGTVVRQTRPGQKRNRHGREQRRHRRRGRQHRDQIVEVHRGHHRSPTVSESQVTSGT